MNHTYTPISDTRIAELNQNAESLGVKIHIISYLSVQEDLEWQVLIDLGAPNTPSDSFAREGSVSAQCQPVIAPPQKDIVLVNFPRKNGGLEKVLDFQKISGLKAASPRAVFSIGIYYPDINKVLSGEEDMFAVLAPTVIMHGNARCMCGMLWQNQTRSAVIPWVISLNNPDIWLAFHE